MKNNLIGSGVMPEHHSFYWTIQIKAGIGRVFTHKIPSTKPILRMADTGEQIRQVREHHIAKGDISEDESLSITVKYDIVPLSLN